jgi:3-methyl-2-oxobutanoate hydroxymethyltransferase
MDEMVLLSRSVSRAAKRVMVVADMPFMSYQVSFEQAIANAGRFLKAIKVEGGDDFAPTVRAIVKMGIPVMGHVGLTVQTALAFGGNYNDKNAVVTHEQIRRDALAMQDAGCFAVVLTKVPADFAGELTRELKIPTLAGGGAGDDCDGQVCVIHSALGLSASAIDAPSTGYGPLSRTIYDTMKQFCEDVREGKPVRTVREKAPA